MSKTLLLVIAGPLTFSLGSLFNWLSLVSWRKAKSAHWSEQARILWPVFASARSFAWTLPSLFVLVCLIFVPAGSKPFLAGIGFMAALGASFGAIPMNRELFPSTPLRTLIRQTLVGFSLSVFYWFVLIAAALAMPAQPGRIMAGVAIGFVAFQAFWAHAGWIWIGRKIGLITSAPDRLKQIVDKAASNLGKSYRRIWLLRSDTAQALAMPITGELVFTERIVALLDDNELEAICAHEIGHLSETRSIKLIRIINSYSSMPWIFLTPLTTAWGAPGFYLLFVATVFLPRLFLPLSQRLERRADQIATQKETDSESYSHALLKIHEANLITVVNPGRQSTHPHLYDRVVAAGHTPDFPRPKAPAAMSWPGYLISALLGILISTVAISKFR